MNMCLLSYFPPNVLPDAASLLCGAECNNDGHGFGILVPGEQEIRIGKGMSGPDVVAQFVALRSQFPYGPALFHSRLTTHGATNEANCHPFVVNGDPRTIVAHNGILPSDARPGRIGHEIILDPKDPSKQSIRAVYDPRSDTRILADDLLMKRWDRLDSRSTRKRLTRWLGTGNKILVLTTDPNYQRDSYLFNAELGTWKDGVWYSNHSFRSYGRGSYSQVPAWWYESGEYPSAAGSSRPAALDDDGREEIHYGYKQDDRGIWVPSTDDRWRNNYDNEVGDSDRAETWPVTLGGTRRERGTQAFDGMVTCDLCNLPDLDSTTGLCFECYQCNDCYNYIDDCHCYGAPRLTSVAYRQLMTTLDNRFTASTIRHMLRNYRQVCTTYASITPADQGDGNGWPKAITAGPSTDSPAVAVSSDGSVQVSVR
jgi:hypothetical protein